MDRSSSAVIIATFVSLFILMASAGVIGNQIPTVPKISEEKALQILQEELSQRIPAFSDAGVWQNGNGHVGYVLSSKFLQNGGHLRLFYLHPNGTLFYINSTTFQILYKCQIVPDDIKACDPLFDRIAYLNTTYGRLMYKLDVDVHGQPFPYVIDANTGEVVYTEITIPKFQETGLTEQMVKEAENSSVVRAFQARYPDQSLANARQAFDTDNPGIVFTKQADTYVYYNQTSHRELSPDQAYQYRYSPLPLGIRQETVQHTITLTVEFNRSSDLPVRMVLVCHVYSFGVGVGDELGAWPANNKSKLIDIINNNTCIP